MPPWHALKLKHQSRVPMTRQGKFLAFLIEASNRRNAARARAAGGAGPFYDAWRTKFHHLNGWLVGVTVLRYQWEEGLEEKFFPRGQSSFNARYTTYYRVKARLPRSIRLVLVPR